MILTQCSLIFRADWDFLVENSLSNFSVGSLLLTITYFLLTDYLDFDCTKLQLVKKKQPGWLASPFMCTWFPFLSVETIISPVEIYTTHEDPGGDWADAHGLIRLPERFMQQSTFTSDGFSIMISRCSSPFFKCFKLFLLLTKIQFEFCDLKGWPT